jgi:hypothetical protein
MTQICLCSVYQDLYRRTVRRVPSRFLLLYSGSSAGPLHYARGTPAHLSSRSGPPARSAAPTIVDPFSWRASAKRRS